MSSEPEARHSTSVNRLYEGGGITVGWEPALCIHFGECFTALPRTFVPSARPWVRIETASADDLAAAIERCPTGALSYIRTDGKAPETPEHPPLVLPDPNGPLLMRGDFKVVDWDGNVLRESTRMALCRCGQSANKPHCDGTHSRIGFRT